MSFRSNSAYRLLWFQHDAGKAPSTPSSLRSSAALAPSAPRTPTTAFSAISSAGLQKSPDQVSPQDVFSFAHGVGLSGREPSPVTVGARLSCISSFFKFLIRMDVLKANPLRSCGTPQASSQRTKRPLRSPDAAAPPRHPRYPSRADATSPSSSLSSSPADADRRSSTSQPAMSPMTRPLCFIDISARAVCAVVVNYLVRP